MAKILFLPQFLSLQPVMIPLKGQGHCPLHTGGLRGVSTTPSRVIVLVCSEPSVVQSEDQGSLPRDTLLGVFYIQPALQLGSTHRIEPGRSTDREDDGVPGKGEKEKPVSSFSKLYHIGDRKPSISKHNVRELNAKQIALEKAKASLDASPKLSKEEKDRTLLRKRGSGGETSYSPIPPPSSERPGLIQGRSVLEQIGTPDFNGWLMKKGEHYNIWKNRYCVLKGHNLYWMRNNSVTVRPASTIFHS